MVRLDIIHASDPTDEQLSVFKSFASVSDESLDELLRSLLKTAMIEVGAWEDKSLLCTSLRLRVDRDRNDSAIRLYRGVSEIDSVKDAEGNPLSYTLDGEYLSVDGYEVVVEYTSCATPGEVARLMPKAMRYATALYDGEDATTLRNILTQR